MKRERRRASRSASRCIGMVGLVCGWLALPSIGAFGQELSLVDRFVGRWEGHGTLFGEPGAFAMTWAPALGGAFVRLTFENPAIRAEALYRTDDGIDHTGTWADSRGVLLPLTAVARDSVLETSWGSAETERGETHYRLLGPDQMEVSDYVLRNGEMSLFARARYERESR